MRRYSVHERATKVDLSKLINSCAQSNPGIVEFVDSLPAILKADDFRSIADAIVNAYQIGKPVVVGFGGHVIKCGLGPLIIELMEKGIIHAIVMNGGASIHDFEIALFGNTSEDVAEHLEDGMFGMVCETPDLMNSAVEIGAASDKGLGQSLGKKLLEINPLYVRYSVLAAGARLQIPITVHSVVGGDTIHMHPSFNAEAFGKASFIDFRLFTAVLGELGNGGVYLNLGSAVVLPEVFLKALNVARNLAETEIKDFVTVNMDMIQHYRPQENVVNRPTMPGGKGYSLIGHHEIMIPLLFQFVLAKIG